MTTRILSTTELASVIEQDPGLPERQRRAIAYITSENRSLDMAFAVEHYRDLDYSETAAIGLVAEDFHKDIRTIRGHYKKYQDYLSGEKSPLPCPTSTR